MDVRLISGIGSGVASAVRPAAGAPTGGTSFTKALDAALKSVSKMQEDASAQQVKYAGGSDSVSLEDTMVSMQKAQVGFQAALTVRNRLVSAYTDIMNMQV